METPYSTSRTYIDEFDPKDYYCTYYRTGENFGDWVDFALKNLHETFTTDGVKGDTLIDFGAGPTIYSTLSACEAFNKIITCEFLEQNRREIQKWLRKDPEAFDWTHIVKAVCELEGHCDIEEKEEKVRRSVIKVVKCDALMENLFGEEKMPQADCFLSCLCLEAPCKDVDSYTNVLRKFRDYIKPGGHLVILSILNCSFYYVGNKKFFSLAITREELERAFIESGYDIVKLKVSQAKKSDVGDHEGYYFVHALKPDKE